MATYKNPWRCGSDYGPEFYKTDAKPKEYRGFTIYGRLAECYDIVKSGVCISQRVTLSGAKQFIDKIYDCPDDYFVQRALGYLK